jgi:hypothetical protein
MILGDKPLISEVVLSQLVPEQDWGKMHTKASKNRNNVFGEERLAHGLDYSSLFRWHANLCANLCNYGIASTKVCCDFYSVYLILLLMTLFCCLWPL